MCLAIIVIIPSSPFPFPSLLFFAAHTYPDPELHSQRRTNNYDQKKHKTKQKQKQKHSLFETTNADILSEICEISIFPSTCMEFNHPFSLPQHSISYRFHPFLTPSPPPSLIYSTLLPSVHHCLYVPTTMSVFAWASILFHLSLSPSRLTCMQMCSYHAWDSWKPSCEYIPAAQVR